MLINLKAQVEVKVRPGSKGANGEAMMDQLCGELNKMLVDFLISRGQDPTAYSWQVKEGNQLMKI